VFYLRNKTSAAVLQSLQQFRAELRRHDPTYELREVRTDGAKEYDSHEARAWYDAKGVAHTSGAPYTPNQTLCEHVWRFLARVVRADTSHSGLDETFWPYPMHEAVALWNLMRSRGARRLAARGPHVGAAERRPPPSDRLPRVRAQE